MKAFGLNARSFRIAAATLPAVAIGLSLALAPEAALQPRAAEPTPQVDVAVERTAAKKPVTTKKPVAKSKTVSAKSALMQAPLGGPFGSNSVWKQKVAGAPVAKNSATLAKSLHKQVAENWGGSAAFNVYEYNVSYFAVPANQPKITVKFHDCQGKRYVPEGLYGPGGQFEDVPIPANATPAWGTDKHLTIHQPSTDKMWDFWLASKRADGWYACWGGRIDNVSKSGGWFGGGFGATATGLSHVGGAIGIKDAQAGRIDHAMALGVITTGWFPNYSWPAQRSDGWDQSWMGIPEGTRFRLDPKVNVDKLGLHPIARTVAKAAQTYGFIVTDTSGAVAVITESGEPTRQATGTNPWVRMMNGTQPYNVMRGFPWDKLQALPTNYGKPTK